MTEDPVWYLQVLTNFPKSYFPKAIFASPLKLSSKVLKRWFIARSRNMFGPRIPYKVIGVS